MKISKTRQCLLNTLFLRLTLWIIMLVLILGQCMFVFAANEEENEKENKVVRVAYVLADDFQEGAEGERKYGYGYEYLKKVSYYTGWKYEYVYGSFAELLQKLANGEIDLMGNISYTEERAQYINFSNLPEGDEYFYVYGYAGQTKIDGNDPSTFNGIKVGVNAGSYQTELFEKWCEEKNVTCELIDYTDENERLADLENGVIDATLATNAALRLNLEPLVQIGKEPYYFGVAKGRDDLLVELNNAMSNIQTANPFYNDELRTKYFNSTSVIMRMLTEGEKEWLKNTSEIKVGYLNNYRPYSVTDANGSMSGMVKDLLDYIKDEYLLDYSSKEFSSYTDMLQALHNNEVDVIFPIYGDLGIAELEKLMVTDPVTTTTLTMYYSDRESEEEDSIAIDGTDPFQEKFALLYFPNAKHVKYNSMEECLKAVINNEVRSTIKETSKIEKANISALMQELQKSTLRHFANVGFGVREGDIELLAVLNKGIGITDESLINNALVTHSQVSSQVTVVDFLREYVVEVFCIIIAIFSIIIGILIVYYRSMEKSKKRMLKANEDIEKARYEAEHDSLTGLLNRKAFQDIKGRLKKSTQPFALLLLDGDKFKEINDTYGHDIGDKVIQKIANQMKEQFRSEDYLIRIGGDEFAAFIMDITSSEGMVIQEKINKINRNLKNSSDGLPSISVSVGITFSSNGYKDELFKNADQALYKTKGQGGCGYTVYE